MESLEGYQPKSFESFVVGFVGDPGVGSTTISRRLHDIEFLTIGPLGESPHPTRAIEELGEIQIHHLSWLLSHLDYHSPEHPNPKHLREFHESLRSQGKGQEVFDALTKFNRGVHIVEKIRHPADASEIRARGGYIVSLVVSSTSISDDRYLTDMTDPKHTSQPHDDARRSALARAKEECEPQDDSPFSSDIKSTKLLAHTEIDVSDTIDTSALRVAQALRNLGLHYLATRNMTPLPEVIRYWPVD